MTEISRRSALLAAVFAAGLGAAAAMASGGGEDGPLSCEIRKGSALGMTALEAVVHAGEAVSGSYSFTVKGSGGGSTNVRQGGAFSAGPDAPVTLGKVTVGGSATYDASLRVEADGMSVECEERFGAI